MNKYIIKKEKEQIDKQASKQTKNKNHQYVRAWKPTFASSILESRGHSNIYIFFIFFLSWWKLGWMEPVEHLHKDMQIWETTSKTRMQLASFKIWGEEMRWTTFWNPILQRKSAVSRLAFLN